MATKQLEKELRRLRKLEEERMKALARKRKEQELKRRIRELKYGKYFRAGEKVRAGFGKVGVGMQKVWRQMEAMEKKGLQKRRAPKNNFASRLNEALSGQGRNR